MKKLHTSAKQNTGILSMVVTYMVDITSRDDVWWRENANQWNHEQHDETKQMKQVEQSKETVEVNFVHKIYDPI